MTSLNLMWIELCFLTLKRKVCIGFIVRDHRGKALMVASIVKSNVANLESIETLVILKGLQLCMHQGISNLIIKSDCLLVVEKISLQEEPS